MPKFTWAKFKHDLSLNGISEVYFWKSNWERFDPSDPCTKASGRYVIYRFVFMALLIAGFVQGVCTRVFLGRFYFIFLTIHSYVFQMLYSAVYFIYILWIYIRRKKPVDASLESRVEGERLPFQCKIIWVLLNIVQVFPHVVSLGFWFIIVPAHTINGEPPPEVGVCEHIHNFVVHLVNFLLAVADSLIVAVPSRAAHCVFAVAYTFLYMIFTILYEVWNGVYPRNREYIYPILNWRRKPGIATVTVLLSLVAVALVSLVFSYGMYLFRVYLRKKHVLQPAAEENTRSLTLPRTITATTASATTASTENASEAMGSERPVREVPSKVNIRVSM